MPDPACRGCDQPGCSGLHVRRVDDGVPAVPLRVEYQLTELGRSLIEPLAALRVWAQHNYEAVAEARETFDSSEPVGLEPVTAR